MRRSRQGVARLLVIALVAVLIVAAVVCGIWWWKNRHQPQPVPVPVTPPPITVATASVPIASASRPVLPASHPIHIASPPLANWPEPGIIAATRETENHVYAGLPRALRKESEYQLLKNTSFWTGYSEYRQNPLWSAYRLGAEEKGIAAGRISHFKSDARLRDPVSHSDYAKTGYDRGHLAPNSGIATRYGDVGQLETFVMSNVCPQKPDLNRKVWETIERLEDDKWGNSLGEVYVITGPVFDQDRRFLPTKKRSDIEIPDAFFKVIVDETSTDARLLAFLVPQDVTGKEKPEQFLVTVDEIEKLSGLDLFPAMSEARQNRLESQRATELFPVR